MEEQQRVDATSKSGEFDLNRPIRKRGFSPDSFESYKNGRNLPPADQSRKVTHTPHAHQPREWMDPALHATGVTSRVTMGTPGELTTSVGRQVPMMITSKEAKGLKSYWFDLRDVQEFEAYARFAQDQSLAGMLTWTKEIRNSLIDAPAKRRIPTILVLMKDAQQNPLLSENRDEWLQWEDEEIFRALRAGLVPDGSIGKSAAGTMVEKVKSLQLRIEDVDVTRFRRYTDNLYKVADEATEPVTAEVQQRAVKAALDGLIAGPLKEIPGNQEFHRRLSAILEAHPHRLQTLDDFGYELLLILSEFISVWTDFITKFPAMAGKYGPEKRKRRYDDEERGPSKQSTAISCNACGHFYHSRRDCPYLMQHPDANRNETTIE